MSKKVAYIISGVLFLVLLGLVVCEKVMPEAGSALLGGILG